MSRRCQRGFAAIFVCALTIGATVAAATPDGQAAAAASQPEVSAQHNVMRGTFTQQKYLAELTQPLVSTGRFVVAEGRGLLWQIEQPVQSQMVITRQRLVRSSDGHEIMRINADQQPALQIVAAVLLAVFQADMDQLTQYFTVHKQAGDGDHWSLTLRPKSAAVAKFIDHVRVRGTTTPRHIEIYQPGGDHTNIDLQPTTGGPDTLSAAERAEFRR